MIMSGSHTARLEAIQRIDIHGTIFCDVAYVHTGEQEIRRTRIGAESIDADLQPGDSIRVTYLMNVATAIERS
jgi:hypothetical protein